MNLRKLLRLLYYRCVRLHGKPREIAMGMAIGLFVGMTPTMSVQMIIAAALAALLGQSKLSAAIAVWITNPLTALPIYTGTYAVGATVMGRPVIPDGGLAHWLAEHSTASKFFTALLSDVAVPLWLGGVVIGIPLGIAGYYATYQAVVAYRLRIRRRRLNRLHVWHWSDENGWERVPNPRLEHHPDKSKNKEIP